MKIAKARDDGVTGLTVAASALENRTMRAPSPNGDNGRDAGGQFAKGDPGKPDTQGKGRRRLWIPQAVACAMLLWALYPKNPYGYYQLLRVVCCVVFAYLAYTAWEWKQRGWVWVLAVVAVVYNPIAALHLTRSVWCVVNLVTAALALASIIWLKDKGEQR